MTVFLPFQGNAGVFRLMVFVGIGADADADEETDG